MALQIVRNKIVRMKEKRRVEAAAKLASNLFADKLDADAASGHVLFFTRMSSGWMSHAQWMTPCLPVEDAMFFHWT
jgi:hypothetical protein